MRAADHVRAALAALLLVALFGGSWVSLYEQSAGGRILLLATLAALPSVVWLVPRLRRGAGVLVAAAATAIAFVGTIAVAGRVSVGSLITLDGDAWRTVGRIIPDGAREASDTSLPLDVDEVPSLAGVLDLAFAGLVACLVWQLAVRRRPLVAIAALGLGLGYRWTVVAPESPALQGAVTLAAALVVLRLLRPTGPAGPWRSAAVGRVVLVGGAVVVASALVGAGSAEGGEGWWNWRAWDVSGAGGSFNLNLEQEYGQLDWPDAPIPLFRVESTRQTPLRAVVLERFDGVAFREQSAVTRELAPVGRRYDTGEVIPAGEQSVEQRVTLLAGDSPLVLAGGRPVNLVGPFSGSVSLVGQSIKVDPALRRGQTYGVTTWLPDPTPSDLVAVRDYRPEDVTGLPHLLSVPTGAGSAVEVPVWGTGLRPQPEEFGVYEDVYRLSREWIGDATSAYQAVNAVESRLRGRFVYDEKPPTPPQGEPPIRDFLITTKSGFCQQFAASMALMLRMNGIPARVAVGFASGRYDAAREVYEVVDRDAHSWVEVWFPEQGWLPFDPTPAAGRFAPNRASVSNPAYRRPNVDLQLEDQPVNPPRADPPVRRPPEQLNVPDQPSTIGDGDAGLGRSEIVVLSVLGALLLAAVLPGVKAARRVMRRRRGDDRARVLGALQEFESTLSDLGMAPDPSLTASERGEALRAAAGLDAGELYRRAADARFSRRPPPPDAARWCWRECRRLRRDARRAAPAAVRWSSPFRVRSLRRANLSER